MLALINSVVGASIATADTPIVFKIETTVGQYNFGFSDTTSVANLQYRLLPDTVGDDYLLSSTYQVEVYDGVQTCTASRDSGGAGSTVSLGINMTTDRPSDCYKLFAGTLGQWVKVSGQVMYKITAEGAFLDIPDETYQVKISGGGTPPPIDEPTEEPTDTPTDTPTDGPTDGPTDEPTEEPTDTPTDTPTDGPTDPPTDEPTDEPTEPPTDGPTDPPAVPDHSVPKDGEYCFQVPGDPVTQRCGSDPAGDKSTICVTIEGKQECGPPSCLVQSGMTLDSKFCREEAPDESCGFGPAFDFVGCVKLWFVPDVEDLLARCREFLENLMIRFPFGLLDAIPSFLVEMKDATKLDSDGYKFEFKYSFGCENVGDRNNSNVVRNSMCLQEQTHVPTFDFFASPFENSGGRVNGKWDSPGETLMEMARPFVTGLIAATLWITIAFQLYNKMKESVIGQKIASNDGPITRRPKGPMD